MAARPPLCPDAVQYLITGTMTMLCRHGMLLYMANMFTGERHAYAIALVRQVLRQSAGIAFLWYDIACRWSMSYRKWLAQQGDEELQRLGQLRALVPPWHIYAHKYVAGRGGGGGGKRRGNRSEGE